MRIPVSRGRVDAQAQMQSFTPNNGLAEIGQAIGGAIQGRQDKQAEQDFLNKRLELYNNNLAELEGKLKVDDFLTTSFTEKTTLLRNEVANGTKNSKQASEELKTWTDTQFKDLSSSLPMHAMHTFKSQVDSTVGRQSADFLPLQLRSDAQKGLQLVEQAFGMATRLPRDKRQAHLEPYLANANIPEAQKTEYRKKLEITSDKMDLDGRMLSAVENNDIAGLQALSSELDKGGFENLDGETVQNYQKSISSKMASLQQKQQVLEQKRVNEAGKVVDTFKQSVLTGRALDPKYIEDVRTAVSGTEYQADFDFYYNQSQNFQDFGELDTSEQLKRINQQKAKMKNSTSADPTTENKVLSVYESIYQNKVKTIKENPNQALREKGINLPELNPLQLKADPKGFASNVIDIGAYQVSQRDKDANATIKPISPEELPEAKKAFDSLDVNGKLNFIGNLIAESKGVKDGTKIWSAALEQLGGGDRVYLLAGLAKNKNRAIGNQNLADTLINGQLLVDKGGFVLPTALEQKFRERYGNLNTLGNYADDLKQFQLSYASIANSNNIKHAKKDDVPDTNTINKAFDLATGGVYEQEPNSWFGSFKTPDGASFKKWNVPKPYGMDDDKFESLLAKGYESLAKQSGYQVAELKQFLLVPRMSKDSNLIMYNLVDVRGRKLKGPNGKEQFIIFNGVTK